MKTGWWVVKFDLTLEGEDVRWDDLDECSQEHILESIKDGYCQGEIVMEDDEPNLPTELTVHYSYISDYWDEINDDEQGEAIGDYLSNKYEYCHDGFDYEELENGDIHITNIQWDTEE